MLRDGTSPPRVIREIIRAARFPFVALPRRAEAYLAGGRVVDKRGALLAPFQLHVPFARNRLVSLVPIYPRRLLCFPFFFLFILEIHSYLGISSLSSSCSLPYRCLRFLLQLCVFLFLALLLVLLLVIDLSVSYNDYCYRS